VAEVAGRGVLGVVRFGPDPDHPERGHVFSLYVAPDGQGLGLGRALLTAAGEALGARGAVDRVGQPGKQWCVSG
jgi:ribosomal protein S18 acetylase RimI-like enzyme